MAQSVYYDIYNKIKKDINKGLYKVYSTLPSERSLMKIFSVSRTTIRAAIGLLEKDKIVYKVKGKGTYVSGNSIVQNLNVFYSFHETMKSMGKIPSSKVVEFRQIEGDETLSEIFTVPLHSKFYYIKRLRLADGDTVMFERTYIPTYRFPDLNILELDRRPMYEIFRDEYNVIFEKAIESLKPIIFTSKEDIEYLNVEKDVPAMEIQRKTYENSKVIEYTISHVRGEMFEYRVELNNI